MHMYPYYFHNRRLETLYFTLPVESIECSHNKPSKCLAVDPVVWENSQTVPLIGKWEKDVYRCEVIQEEGNVD